LVFGFGQEIMERAKGPPRRLYKYRALTARTLDVVVGDKLHFADPSTFNDPLDTRPSLDNDVDVGELRRILWMLTEQRSAAEMRAAADASSMVAPINSAFVAAASALVSSEMKFCCTHAACSAAIRNSSNRVSASLRKASASATDGTGRPSSPHATSTAVPRQAAANAFRRPFIASPPSEQA